MTDWTIITRSLRTRLFSTVTTTITVAVAVALMLVLLMMRASGQRAFRSGTGNMHILITADTSPLVSVLNGVFFAGAPRRPIPWEKYNQLAQAAPWSFFIPTQLGDSYQGLPVLATTPEFFTKFEPIPGRPFQLAQGAFFDKSFQIVLGSRAAQSSGLKVGDTLHVTHGTGGEGSHVHGEYTYTVVGVLAPTGSSHDRAIFSDLTSTWILHGHDRREREEAAEHAGESAADHAEHDHEHEPPFTEADLKDEDRKITGVYAALQTRPGSNTPANLPQVFDMLRRDPAIMVAQPNDEITRLMRIVGNVDQILVAMAGVVMASSGIAIMLALYNSMEQRRRQIAVLRVLGASRGRIFGLVVTESSLLGVLGGIVGIGLAVGGGWVVAAVMRQRLGLDIDPTLPVREVVIVAAATVALAALAGLIPAFMAYRTPVAKNLRPLG